VATATVPASPPSMALRPGRTVSERETVEMEVVVVVVVVLSFIESESTLV
jgi:hypothetical protein